MFLVWLCSLVSPLLSYERAWRCEGWARERFMRKAEHYIVHRLKTEWIFSGVRQDDRGYFSDIGIVRSEKKLNRRQAIRHLVRDFPRATIKHIDDRNKIITYAVGG